MHKEKEETLWSAYNEIRIGDGVFYALHAALGAFADLLKDLQSPPYVYLGLIGPAWEVSARIGL
jgi:hypothetical protein